MLDLWIHDWRQRHAKGEVPSCDADDFVIGFREESDAEVFAALRERLPSSGWNPHPEKTPAYPIRTIRGSGAKRGAGRRRRSTFWVSPTLAGRPGEAISRSTAERRGRIRPSCGDQGRTMRRMHQDCHGSARGYRACFAAGASIALCPATPLAFGSCDALRGDVAPRPASSQPTRVPSDLGEFSSSPDVGRRRRNLHPYPNVRFASQHPR